MKLKLLVPLVLSLLAACTSEEGAFRTTDDGAPVQIHFDYLGSCTRLLGNEGKYVVFQIDRIQNDSAETFRFEPQRVRFRDANAQSQKPLLIVPELSEIEVAARDEQPVREPFLLQYGDAEAPALARKVLVYEDSGVRMVPSDASAAEQPIDCDQYAT
jgi:hypothetical protein